MPDLLLLGLFFFAIFGSIGIAGYLFLGRGEASAAEAPESAREALTGTLLSIGEAVPVPKGAAGMRRKLISAGYRSPAAVTIYTGGTWAIAAIFGLVTVTGLVIYDGSLGEVLLPAVCAAGFGYLLPNRILTNRIASRARKISSGLPTALDLLVLSVEAGQSIDSSLADASRELRRAYPELADEFTQVYLSLRASTTRAEVFRDFAVRIPDLDVKKLCNLLIDSDRFGTSLGPTLRTHARYLRIRRRQLAQESARKVGVKLVFPIFFFIFPSVLLVTLGPAVLQMMTSLSPLTLR